MRKVLLVARREYTFNLRRPAFLFAAFGAPLISVLAMVIVVAVITSSEATIDDLGQIGYVDQAGVLAEAIDEPETFRAYTDAETAAAALAAGELGAYFVVPETYLASGDVQLYTNLRIPEDLYDVFDDFLIANLSQRVTDPVLLDRILDPVEMTATVQDSGRQVSEDSILGLIFVPMIFALVFYLAMQTTSSYLMSSVVEEKTTRMMEILVTSIKPLEMLMGKITGLGLLGLTQLAVWLAAGVLLLQVGQGADFLTGVTLPLDLILISLVYFFLSYFLYASLMAGIGVVFGSEQESRQFAAIFTILAVAPFFFVASLFTDPDGTVMTALTLIPFTAPVTVIMRLSLTTIPTWQMAASLGLLLLTTAFLMWASARVFRWALLMYGKRPTPRELWRVVRGRNEARFATVAQEDGA